MTLPTPYYQEGGVTIYHGDSLTLLMDMGAKSIQCCITSPPYWGLRDYGIDGQLGLESTPEAYVENMVKVFREVWRVLKDDGTLWLNLGSSYFSNNEITTGGCSPKSTLDGGGGKYRAGSKNEKMFNSFSSGGRNPNQSRQPSRVPACGTDDKALQDLKASDYAYSDLCDECLAGFQIHHARIVDNSQLTSQSERPSLTISHDIAPMDDVPLLPGGGTLDVPVSTMLQSWRQHRGGCLRCDRRASSLSTFHSSTDDAQESVRMPCLNYTTIFKQKDMVPIPWMVAMALQADGWYLRQDIIWHKPNPMPESVQDRCTKSHEYVFMMSKSQKYYYDAEAIAEPSTYAPGCGWNDEGHEIARKTADVSNPAFRAIKETRNKRSVWTIPTKPYKDAHFATFPPDLVYPCLKAGSRQGNTILDPFMGSGTVNWCAKELGRKAIGMDLNEEYCALAKDRLGQEVLPLFCTEPGQGSMND